MKQGLAIFDFDGTLTDRDTLWQIIGFLKGGLRMSAGLVILSPMLSAYAFGLATNTRVKEAVMTRFFGGMNLEDFQLACGRFARERVPAILRPGALETIRSCQDQGFRVLVVSASAQNWVGAWCEAIGLECVATRLQVVEGRLTGKIAGANCHGKEKVSRIRELLNPADYAPIFTYGDEPADRPMLSLGTQSFYRPFRRGG